MSQSDLSMPLPEWSHRYDDLGVFYCLGRSIEPNQQEVAATYFQTDLAHATKQELDGESYYRRFIYQGLPEQRAALSGVEREEVRERLLARTEQTKANILIDPHLLTPSDPGYAEIATWLGLESPKANPFQQALQIACTALNKVGVTIEELGIYGAASFGLVNVTDKVVDDVDVVFKTSNLAELRGAIEELQTGYLWEEIDPFSRLATPRQQLKAKRWSTSQIRLNTPYPLSIDLKVGREPGAESLWDKLPAQADSQTYDGELYVLDDTEGLCTSPALLCADQNDQQRILLLEGYQYIGSAVAGDVIKVRGRAYNDSPVIHVTASEHDSLLPDFSNVPVT